MLLVLVVLLKILPKLSYINFLNVVVWCLGVILQTAMLLKYADTLKKTRASVVELEKELSSINEVPSRSFGEVKKIELLNILTNMAKL